MAVRKRAGGGNSEHELEVGMGRAGAFWQRLGRPKKQQRTGGKREKSSIVVWGKGEKLGAGGWRQRARRGRDALHHGRGTPSLPPCPGLRHPPAAQKQQKGGGFCQSRWER